MPRTNRLAHRRPTGRYVYESSSDEDSDAAGHDDGSAAWRKPVGGSSLGRLGYDSSESESDESDAVRVPAHRLAAQHLRLANELDSWDAWEQHCQQRAWVCATACVCADRQHTVAPRLDAAALRRSSRARSATPRIGGSDSDVKELQDLLSKFQLQQREVERKDREAFEQRNSRLWDGIERAIHDAEKRAADEAEQLANARRRQEEAKAEAKRARDAELARIAAEERAEKERAEKEAEEHARRQKQEQKELVYNSMRGGEWARKTAAAEYEHWRVQMQVCTAPSRSISRTQHIKEDVLPAIAKDADLRKRCFATKRAITPKIGQLTNSREQITSIVRTEMHTAH